MRPDDAEVGRAALADLDLGFFIIGAQKCATSWLFSCLAEHPETALPRNKREIYYLGGAEHGHRGDAWFISRYGSANRRVPGDASVEYLDDPESAAYLHGRVPSAKIIVCLRDPIDRAISAHFWALRHGRVDVRDVSAVLRALLNSGSADREGHDFLTRGLYAERLNRYWERYGKEQLHVLLFEQLKADPMAALGDLYRFLGVDVAFVPESLHTKPKTNTYAKSMIEVERRLGRVRALRKLADIVNQSLDRMGLGRTHPTLAPELRDALISYYAADLRDLMTTLDSLPKSPCPGFDKLGSIWPTVAALEYSAGKTS